MIRKTHSSSKTSRPVLRPAPSDLKPEAAKSSDTVELSLNTIYLAVVILLVLVFFDFYLLGRSGGL